MTTYALHRTKMAGKNTVPGQFFSFWNPAPRIHRSHLCAGGEEERDTCTGDGGGPLLCAKETTAKAQTPTADDIDEVFKDEVAEDNVLDDEELFSVDLRGVSGESVTLVQAGITAWGIGCGRAGIPAVYTDLASAACWLDQVTS